MHPGEIDPSWLTPALEPRYPGVRVAPRGRAVVASAGRGQQEQGQEHRDEARREDFVDDRHDVSLRQLVDREKPLVKRGGDSSRVAVQLSDRTPAIAEGW